MTLTDSVRYENLTPKKLYTLTGTLMDKESGEALLDSAGNLVSATATLTPATFSGSAELSFTFDASGLAGRSVVAFESLSCEGKEVATHADINDTDQTVQFPSLHTLATDAKTKGHEANADGQATITDEVSYTNLIAKKSYI